MKIGGFQKTTLLDYPKHVSSIIWTVGCNFRCPFCYNTELVKEKAKPFSEEEITKFLEEKKNFLEALVISGGEPFLQKDLELFCKKIKKMGYKIKIDTNGTYPEKLQKIIDKKLVDYVSMDVKAPKEKYNSLSGVKTDIKKIDQSIKIIQDSGLDYEFKTTFIPNLLTKKDIIEIAKWLEGSEKYFLQQFKNDTTLISKDLEEINTYTDQELNDTLKKIKPYFKNCELRGN